MKIPDIKRNLSIATVLGHYGLQPDKNNRLTCPWHPDKTPSLQIYPKTNTWTCFSTNCDAGSGDVIDFVMKYENISKYEAIQKATALAGDTMMESSPVLAPSAAEVKQQTAKAATESHKTPKAPVMDRVTTLNKAFDYFKTGVRSNSKSLREFLESRSLNRNRLEIGYNSGQLHHRENSEYVNSYLHVHLLSNNPHGGYRVFAKHCVMFPLKDRQGQIVSFYGRSILPASPSGGDNDTSAKLSTGSSKHYYLKDTQGLYPTYPPADTQRLVIPECIIDTATLMQLPSIAGGYRFLSAYGTNRLTEEHIEAIRELKNLEEIIFFFDGDDAGRKAVEKYSEKLRFLVPGITISNVNTPDEEDINSLYVKYDADCLETLLNERTILYSPSENKGISTIPIRPLNAPVFNSSNHEALTYETTELHLTVLGGIKISGLERMKVTLKIQVKTSHYAPLRQHLDLYNNEQLTRLIRTVNEQMDVKTETIRKALLSLIEELETYRINRINRMQSTQKRSPDIAPNELTDAESYLKKEKLMERTMDELGKTGIVGEINNRLIMYLVFLSRITTEPLHIISFGASGSGKTHLQEGIGRLLPEEAKLEITAMSSNSLYYLKNEEIQHKVLLIEDMDGAQEVLYPLRELQTKQKLTKRVSIKDTQGNIKTIQVTVEGAVCIAGCTTKHRIYEDNANRSLLIHIDGSTEQDERIMAYQRAVSGGKVDKDEELKYQRLLRNVQRIIQPVKVVNPYAPDLKIPSEVFKKRRSNWLYLRFIEIITLYHQYQREQKVDKQTGEIYIETTLEDIAWANKLLKDILLRKADELTEPARNFFERLKKWLKENKQEQFRTSEIREQLHVTVSSLKRYLSELTSCGHIKITGGNRTRGYAYEVSSYEEYQKLKHSIDHVLDSLLEQLKRKTLRQAQDNAKSGSVVHSGSLSKTDHPKPSISSN